MMGDTGSNYEPALAGSDVDLSNHDIVYETVINLNAYGLYIYIYIFTFLIAHWYAKFICAAGYSQA